MDKEYGKRDTRLARMGFWSYRAYLKSDLWKAIRASKLQSVDERCELCSNRATVVHHTNYSFKTLRGRYLSGLIALCHECHCRCEFDESGRKLRLEESRLKTRTLLKQRRSDRASCQGVKL